MYMSVIQLNQSDQVMNQCGRFNEEIVHQVLLSSIGNPSRSESHLLYRKDKNELCVYSEELLNQDKLLKNGYFVRNAVDVGHIYNNIDNGDTVKLFFRTVPSKKVQRDGKKNSARIGLHQRDDRLNWVERKLSEHGATIVRDLCKCPLILENGFTKIVFKHFNHQKNKGDCELTAYDYVVTVQIKDRDLFLNMVKNGIGPYKSYGCGLILIGAV